MLALIIILASVVIVSAMVGYKVYSDRQFDKSYREFKRKQRQNREKFFASLKEDQ